MAVIIVLCGFALLCLAVSSEERRPLSRLRGSTNVSRRSTLPEPNEPHHSWLPG